MIDIREKQTRDEIKEFVLFKFNLLKDHKYWVPPLIREEMEVFNRQANPVFNFSDARLFMAYREGKAVGRVAAIINWNEVNKLGKSKMRFGWLDMENDPEVTRALLEEVEQWARENELEYIEGPVGFSNLDKAGMLVEGFEEMNTMITWYNPPYYSRIMENLGFEKEKEWVEFKIRIPEEGPSQKVRRFANLIMERNNLQLINFSNTKQILARADEMFNLINETYKDLPTFVPFESEQIEYYKDKYFRYLHPDFINCVENKEGELVAFAITMPSFARALKKAKGRLFPLGWLHLLKARYFNDRAAFYLIGIHPGYQNKGVTAIIFKEMNEVFNRRGISEVETNPELKENKAVQALWERYENEQHKRRRTYKREVRE